MTIGTIALVEPGDIIRTSKDKVTVTVGQKGDQSYKFDSAYPSSDIVNVFSNHVQKPVADVLSGLNSTLVTASTTLNGNDDTYFGGENSFLHLSTKEVFLLLQRNSSRSEYLVAVSMLQIGRDGKCSDLILPHNRKISIKHHSKQGIFVEGLSQFVCSSADDVMRLCEDGAQVQNSLKLNPYVTCITVRILQRPVGTGASNSSCSYLKFVSVYADKSNINKVTSLFNEISRKKGKLNKSGFDSPADEILVDALLGNSNVFLIADVDGKDVQLSSNVLSLVQSLSGVGSAPKANREDGEVMIQQLRSEIGRMRNKLASQSPPNKNDLSLMEKLISDLEETKRIGWDQTSLRSDQFHEERKMTFANKGLTWILESNRKANRENVKNLQKLKDKLTADYKNQRAVADRLNVDLKRKIDNYTQLINSGNSDDNAKKSHVAAISDLKDQYRKENDKLKDIKNNLKDAQAKLQSERQSGFEESASSFDVAFEAMKEEREKTRQENEQLVDEELEKSKIEVEQEKADLQVKLSSKSLIQSEAHVLRSLVDLAQLRSEKSVMTTQLDVLKKERMQSEEHMRLLAEKHARELEIQQLQSLQTFRAYREVFEEYKVELENRWRSLLDDAVQDAVYLNARNTELMEELARLKLENAKFQDDRSIGKASIANNL